MSWQVSGLLCYLINTQHVTLNLPGRVLILLCRLHTDGDRLALAPRGRIAHDLRILVQHRRRRTRVGCETNRGTQGDCLARHADQVRRGGTQVTQLEDAESKCYTKIHIKKHISDHFVFASLYVWVEITCTYFVIL